jgi:1-acyl-sn-glycerol-3-phosphate acyltransferase
VPVRVWGTFEAFGRHVRFPKPKRVMVKYSEPMLFIELRVEAKSCSKERLKEIYQQMANEILAAIAKLEPKEDDMKRKA